MPVLFFIAGFTFDAFMVGPIDHPLGMLQQVAYLALIGYFITLEIVEMTRPLQIPKWLQKFWHYREELVHFQLGTLLNVYTLFYIKSSSIFSSFIFMAVIAGMLVANEHPRFKKFGVITRFSIFSLCVVSFFACTVPVFLKFMGIVPFVISIVLSAMVLGLFYWILEKKNIDGMILRRNIVEPGCAVILLFVFLYWAQLIPPVPLAVKSIGIYFDVEKEKGSYKLSYVRPGWKFWQKGAQSFTYRSGDKIVCFVSIFSPTHFKDQIFLRWMFKDPRFGWQNMDRIPMLIAGGREEGFRGYVAKTNYQGGDWKILVETTDGREVGRIYFTATPDDNPTASREFKFDLL